MSSTQATCDRVKFAMVVLNSSRRVFINARIQGHTVQVLTLVGDRRSAVSRHYSW